MKDKVGTQSKHNDTENLTEVQEGDRLRYKRTNEVKHRCTQKKGGRGQRQEVESNNTTHEDQSTK